MELLKRVFTVNSEDNKESDPATNGNMSNSKPPKDNNNRKTDQKKTEDNTEAKKLLDEYADVFKGLGCLEGHYHIKIDSSVLPVVHPARKVPFAIKDRLKAELDRMENIGAITKVTEPTEWVNSIVVTEKKNGNVHVCLDPRDLNKAVKREYYPMRTVEEIAAQLSGSTVFSTLDASCAIG
ncbi:hypothetical protein QZH41_005777 [Actinostola sp. cb2023]|nr:hypothetical protein QZH41_005777 [Actinostola sp. cb2023]